MIAWAPKIMTSSFAPPFHRRPKRPRGHPCQKGFLYPSEDAGVAQLAEQLFCKQQVTGSIPVAGSTCRIFPHVWIHARRSDAQIPSFWGQRTRTDLTAG